MFFYSNCQSMLPATGAPISRHRTSKMKEMFDEYVRARTRENWKFWIVSFLKHLLWFFFSSYDSTYKIRKFIFSYKIISSVYYLNLWWFLSIPRYRPRVSKIYVEVQYCGLSNIVHSSISDQVRVYRRKIVKWYSKVTVYRSIGINRLYL